MIKSCRGSYGLSIDVTSPRYMGRSIRLFYYTEKRFGRLKNVVRKIIVAALDLNVKVLRRRG